MSKPIIYGIVLARGGSKTIPSKNIAVINGKSLLQRAIEVLNRCESIQKVYVSSDDELMLSIAEKYGAVPVRRPPELSSDSSSSFDAIKHFLDSITFNPEYLVESMCTAPFKTTKSIQECIDKVVNNRCDSVEKEMSETVKRKINFMEIDTVALVEKFNITDIDVLISSDHLMHIDYDSAKIVINKIRDKWTPYFILIKETNQGFERHNVLPKLYHNYNFCFNDKYRIVYNENILDGAYMLKLWRRNE